MVKGDFKRMTVKNFLAEAMIISRERLKNFDLLVNPF